MSEPLRTKGAPTIPSGVVHVERFGNKEPKGGANKSGSKSQGKYNVTFGTLGQRTAASQQLKKKLPCQCPKSALKSRNGGNKDIVCQMKLVCQGKKLPKRRPNNHTDLNYWECSVCERNMCMDCHDKR